MRLREHKRKPIRFNTPIFHSQDRLEIEAIQRALMLVVRVELTGSRIEEDRSHLAPSGNLTLIVEGDNTTGRLSTPKVQYMMNVCAGAKASYQAEQLRRELTPSRGWPLTHAVFLVQGSRKTDRDSPTDTLDLRYLRFADELVDRRRYLLKLRSALAGEHHVFYEDVEFLGWATTWTASSGSPEVIYAD